MLRENRIRRAVLITANVLLWCVLGFYETGTAAPKESNEPFANSIVQRNEIISQLKEVVAELKAQRALLQSGTVKVVVEQGKR